MYYTIVTLGSYTVILGIRTAICVSLAVCIKFHNKKKKEFVVNEKQTYFFCVI